MIRHLRRKMTLMVLLSLFVIMCLFVGSINLVNWQNLKSQAEATLELLAANQGVRPSSSSGSSDTSQLSEESAASTMSVMIGTGETDQPDSTPPPLPDGMGGEGGMAPMPPDGAGREGGPGENGGTAPPPPDGTGSPGENGSTPPPKPDESNRAQERGQPPSSRESIAGLSNYYTITLNDDGTVAEWDSDRSDLYTDEQIAVLAYEILETGRETGNIGTQFFLLTEVSQQEMLIVLDERVEVLRASELLRYTILLGVMVYALLGAGAVLVIRRMFVPVEEAARRQKEFVWDASHELKTPIAVISANAEVLEREVGKNEWLGYIRSEVERTTQLVQSLLELARTDRETTRAQMRDFDLSRAILSVALPFESTVFESGRTMEMDIAEGMHMTGAEEMIQRLVVILLSNAVKYANPGGNIRLTACLRGRSKAIRVHNTGSFIEKADQTRIFDRFYRVDAAHSREVEGHGLGLAIAKNIVETHGGRIHVESDRQTGTAFEVVFP